MNTLSVRVMRKTREALDICSFELAAADGTPLPPFSAGSHIDVSLPRVVAPAGMPLTGTAPAGLTRQYSLCNDPAETHRYLIGVLRDPASRGGSQAMHDQVNEGDLLEISAPKNHFALAHGARKHVLLAGGIGITPILCMAERLGVLGAEFELHYCARSRRRMAFMQRIQGSPFASRVQLHFDDEDPAQRLDLAAVLTKPQDGVHLYVCGPKGFMDAALGNARGSGWPEAQLHYEFFTAAPVATDGDGAFDVKLASSGRVVRVPAGVTVIDALAEAGVQVPVSCGQGICGTCLTRVIEGTPEHRDLYLSPEEQAQNDQFTPCCSRSKSACLVLDL